MKRLTTEEFKKKYEEKFGELYDLSKAEYVNNTYWTPKYKFAKRYWS